LQAAANHSPTLAAKTPQIIYKTVAQKGAFCSELIQKNKRLAEKYGYSENSDH